jgi:hypothetical protein
MSGRGKAEKSAARQERLAAALRENLKRRKAQARDRAGGPAPGDTSAAGETRNETNGPDFRRNPGWNSGDGSGGTDR